MSTSPTSNDRTPQIGSDQQLEAVVERYLEGLKAGIASSPEALAEKQPELQPMLLPRLRLVARLFASGRQARTAPSQSAAVPATPAVI